MPTSSVSHVEGLLRVLTTTQDLEPEIMQRLVSFVASKTQVQLQTASNGYDTIARAITDGQVNPLDLVRGCIQEFRTEMTKNMALSARVVELIEKKQPQTPSLDQITMLRKRVQSILARNYESISSQPTQHIHLAKHEGYDIVYPKEFFQQYGGYALTILQMLKFGSSEAGITVPALSHLVDTDGIDQSAVDLQLLADTIESGMDLVMGYIEKISADNGGTKDMFEEQMGNSEALENVDLCHLETFLKKKKGHNKEGAILPTNKPQQSMTDLQKMADFLESLDERFEILNLSGYGLDQSAITALAKSTENGFKLKELTLDKVGRSLGEQCIKDLASIVARSELRKLDIHLENEEERVQILESVQWSHIHNLVIRMNEGGQGMRYLKTVVHGIEKLSRRTQAERFELYHEAPRRFMPIGQEQPLRSFVASASLRHLRLEVLLAFEQIISLVGSLNVSRLLYLFLMCEDLNSTEVEAIMDKLQHATELRTVILWKAKMLDEQRERMKAKGATLKNAWL
ncbi:hypothetical protein BGX34_006915 [Mortierella sp. NVP85]|nr:hypothetical protein BGX34_006915 [Mortierella sp. NVP85]